MKKMVRLFTLLVFLWTSFLTSVSYAQITEMWSSDASANEEFQNNVSNDITETNNSVDENYDDSDQFTSQTSDDSLSLQMDNRELNIALDALPQRSWTMFIPWEEFNLRLKNLANDNYNYAYNKDVNIINFKKSSTPAPLWVTTTWLATDDSEYEIISWYDNWTIYYYSEADKIYLNPDSKFMFGWMISLAIVDTTNWDTSKVIDMSEMFSNDAALKNIDIISWNTSNVEDMGEMFNWCLNLSKLDLSSWDTSNVEDMSYMFETSDSLESIYVSDKFVTNNVSEWYDMFIGAYSLIWWNWRKYDSSHTDYDYANIDTAQNPWYFTNISWNTVIVRFFTNGWSEVDPQVVSKWGTIGSVTPNKENAIFKWWYTDEWLTRNFNTSTAINSNMKLYAKWECKPWYYDNKWMCTDENKKIEHKWWIIKITDGENVVYIKDRNQWATEAKWSTIIHKIINPILQKYKNWKKLSIWRLYRYVAKELSEISWEEMFTLWELFRHYDNDAVKLIKDIKSKYKAWNYLDSFGNYYYWGNNTWVSYDNLWIWEISGSIDVSFLFGGSIHNEDIENLEQETINLTKSLVKVNLSPEILSKWFTGWKIWEENTWWEKWNTNNPCDSSKWEYLPTLQDWVKLMQVWWNINWYELVKTEQELWENSYGEVYVFGSWLDNLVNWISNSPIDLLELVNLDITEDLMIPWAWWIVKYDSDLVREIIRMQGAPEEVIDNIIEDTINYFGSEYIRIPIISPLWVASDSWDTVGIYIWEAGLISVTNDIWKIANSIAMPVRCFVDESAWPVDETPNEKEHHYSGWWGRWGSSSKSDTEADTHWAADDQKDTDKDKKTEEKQENTQNENKSETPTPQNNQWNKWSNSASNEVQQAYNFVHSYGITNKTSVENAKMDNTLTRIQMAKMLSQYAINVLGKEPDVSKWVIRFSDVTNKMNKDYDNWVNLAYQLWIMWQNMKDNKFRPNDEVSRAELVTALSRLLYSTSDGEYKSTWKYYVNHMEKLKKEWIITKDNPKMKEKRWYIMLMLMRSVK